VREVGGFREAGAGEQGAGGLNSEIIQVLNDRFGTELNDADALLFEQIKAQAAADDRIVQTALANPLDKFELGIRKLIEDLMLVRMAGNDKIVSRYMSDPAFQAAAYPILAREIFEAVRGEGAGRG
jgi:type I restriction enzyme, R subunit